MSVDLVLPILWSVAVVLALGCIWLAAAILWRHHRYFAVPPYAPCPACQGDRLLDHDPCPYCADTGKVTKLGAEQIKETT